MTTMLQTAAPATAGAQHLLTLGDLGPGQLRELLDLSYSIKHDRDTYRNRLAGGRLGLIFHKPSTRTRVSFESAAWLLGMLPSVMRADELQLGRGETIADTARTLSLYLDAVAIRTFSQATVEELAGYASIPIINALTDEHHPCQALADVLTLEEEFGTVAGIQVAFIGDGDNVCTSLIEAAALAGFELRVATPVGYEPPADVVARARSIGEATGATIVLTNDPREAVFGAEAIYADVWTSMGKEGEQQARLQAFAGFTVDQSLMDLASRSAVFMHCLPAHRGEEVTDEVIDGSRSRVWPQAANRMHTEAALLLWLLR
jgi:ornithine carbamoyltransferase